MKTNNSNLIYIFLFLAIFFFLQYVFWFQYVIIAIDSFLTIISILMIILELLLLKTDFALLKKALFVFIFIFLSFFSSFFFSYDRAYSISLVGRIIRYVVPFLAMVLYVGRSKKRMRNLLFALVVSGFCLSISLFFRMDQFLDGLTVGDLNTNTLSTFLLCSLIGCALLVNISNSKTLKILLVLSSVVLFAAQFLTESRRGILIFIFFLLSFLLVNTFIRHKKQVLIQLFLVATIIVFGFIIFCDFTVFGTPYSSVFEMFSKTSGDLMREQYQAVAVDIFKSNPIFGSGLGSVGYIVGMYSHSLFYELLSAVGIVGFLSLIVPLSLMCIYFIFHIFKHNSYIDLKKKTQFALLVVSIITVLISGIAVAFIYDIIFYVVLGLFVSFCNVYVYDIERASKISFYK